MNARNISHSRAMRRLVVGVIRLKIQSHRAEPVKRAGIVDCSADPLHGCGRSGTRVGIGVAVGAGVAVAAGLCACAPARKATKPTRMHTLSDAINLANVFIHGIQSHRAANRKVR